MAAIGDVSLDTIEKHLLRLGGGNHYDNIARLRRFERHCSMSLAEKEFFELVFLQNDDVNWIAPRGDDRTLRAVAKRAIHLGHPRLDANWDLAENLRRMRNKLGEGSIFQEALVFAKPGVARNSTGHGTSKMARTERSHARR
jgi:hypothetical protein